MKINKGRLNLIRLYFNSYIILDKKRKYFIEGSLLFIIGIFIINGILPTSNVLYFLLILPALIAIYFFAYISIQIFNNPQYGIAITALFLPFERIGALNISSINIRLSQLFIIFTIIAYVLFETFHKNGFLQIKIKRDITYFLLLLFGVVNIISLTSSINRSRSIEVMFFDFFIFFVFIFVSNLLKSEKILHQIVKYILVVSLIVSIYGLFQFAAGMLNLPTSISGLREGYTKDVFGFPRIQATESEPQFWGNFLLISISLSCSIIIGELGKITNSKYKSKSGFNKKYLLLTFSVLFLGIVNLILTFSRGAWYACIISLGIICLANIKKFLKPKVIISLGILTFLSIGGYLFVLNYTNAPITIDKLVNRASSTDDLDRDLTTKDAIEYFNQNPIFGIGVGSFGPRETINPYQKPSAFNMDIGWRIVNNEYLEILSETGILGIVTFLLFLISIFWKVGKAYLIETDQYMRIILIGFSAASFGLLVQYWGFSTLYLLQVWFTIAILNAIAYNSLYKSWENKNEL